MLQTKNKPKASNSPHPLATVQSQWHTIMQSPCPVRWLRQQVGPAQHSSGPVLHVCCGHCNTQSPEAGSMPQVASLHMMLWCLSLQAHGILHTQQCICLVPCTSCIILDADHAQLLYIVRLKFSSISHDFSQTFLQPLKAEQTKHKRQSVTKTVKAIFKPQQNAFF